MTDEQKKLVQEILELATAIKDNYPETEIGCGSRFNGSDERGGVCLGCAVGVIKRNAKLLVEQGD